MLNRIRLLLNEGVDFAFETTLATRSYVSLINEAKVQGYTVTLLFFWLNSTKLAIGRVAKRVSHGGHNIPTEVIIRRYYRGIYNLVNLYINLCDSWMVNNNIELNPKLVASFVPNHISILDNEIWETILEQANHEK